MKSSFLTTCFAACTLLAAQSTSMAADTNAPATTQSATHAAPNIVRPIQQQGVTTTPVGGLFSVMTEQQRTSYREALTGIRPKLLELDAQLRAARKDLYDASLSTNFNETLIRQKAQAAANIQAEIDVLRIKTITQIQPPLTPEQLEKVKSGQPAPMRQPLQRPPFQPRTGATSTNHDANGLPPKQ